MPPNIMDGKAFWSFGEAAWHSLGTVSNEPLSAKEILHGEFGGGFTVEKRPLYSLLNGNPYNPSKYFSIVRSPTPTDNKEVEFGTCTERYNPLQPWEVAETFDANIGQPVETMAFLGQGEDMFISWLLQYMTLDDGDEIQLYGIVRTGFDTLNATRLFSAVYRPVCWNTVTFAEQWAEKNTDRAKNQGILWKGKGVNPNLREHLGYWMQHVQAKANLEVDNIQRYLNRFIAIPIRTDDEARVLLAEAFPDKEHVTDYPYQLIRSKNEEIDELNIKMEEVREGIMKLFQGVGRGITPTFYGLLNATTEYFNHYQPSKKSTAVSVVFGARQSRMMKMVKVLQKYAK